jgi:hypothetical protein
VEREHAPSQRGQVHERDEEGDRARSPLAHDLAGRARPLQGNGDADPPLGGASQHEEGVVGEGRVIEPDPADRAAHLERVDEPDDDVRVAGQRPARRAELAENGVGLVGRRIDDANPDDASEIRVHGARAGGLERHGRLRPRLIVDEHVGSACHGAARPPDGAAPDLARYAPDRLRTAPAVQDRIFKSSVKDMFSI